MKSKPATTGQIRQLDRKIMQANPAEALSHDEIERLLRDENLVDEISALLRKHRNTGPIRIVPAESPLEALVQLCEKFELYDVQLGSHKTSLITQRNGDLSDTSVLKKALDAFICPEPETESYIEVISFKEDRDSWEFISRLADMGYRPANLQEAAGFLQARGKTFCNAGRAPGVGVHGFVITTGGESASFSRFSEGGWAISTGWDCYRKDILVAKL